MNAPCPRCGASVSTTSVFCPSCGLSLAGSAVATAHPTAEPGGASAFDRLNLPADRAVLDAPFGRLAPASTSARLLAFTIDMLIAAAVGAALYFPTGSLLLGGLGFAEIIIGQWMWEARRGKTIGQLVAGIRTTSVSAPVTPGLGRTVVRGVVTACGAVVAVVGSWVVVGSSAWDSSARKQGWQDKAAKTLTVSVKAGSRAKSQPQRMVVAPPRVVPDPNAVPVHVVVAGATNGAPQLGMPAIGTPMAATAAGTPIASSGIGSPVTRPAAEPSRPVPAVGAGQPQPLITDMPGAPAVPARPAPAATPSPVVVRPAAAAVGQPIAPAAPGQPLGLPAGQAAGQPLGQAAGLPVGHVAGRPAPTAGQSPASAAGQPIGRPVPTTPSATAPGMPIGQAVAAPATPVPATPVPAAPVPATPVPATPTVRVAVPATPAPTAPPAASAASGPTASVINLTFDTGQQEMLPVGSSGVMGRDPRVRPDSTDQRLVIRDPKASISKNHLQFEVGKDRMWIVDSGSTNGTFVVDGGQWRQLPPGDVQEVRDRESFRLGEVVVRVNIASR